MSDGVQPPGGQGGARVPVVRSALGGAVGSGGAVVEMACELRRFSSLLTFEEAQAIQLIDPAPRLGLSRTRSGSVGLLDLGGPPRGVCLGALRGLETWGPQQVLRLPDWLRTWLPPALKGGCGLGPDGEVVWLLELDWLARHG